MMIKNAKFQVFLFCIFQCINFLNSEYVPVYLWETSKTEEHIPALHKISEESFRNAISEHLKSSPYIVVFAEQTLSPEDFTQHSETGKPVFLNLSKLKQLGKASYRPYVKNPIDVIRQLGKDVTEVSTSKLLENFNVPEENILIVDLNDAQENEQRSDMLKRHDENVVTIYKQLLEIHENILAIYTSHHTSWINVEDEEIHRKGRSLLADTPPETTTPRADIQPVVKDERILMYIGDGAQIVTTTADGSQKIKNIVFSSPSTAKDVTTVNVTLLTDDETGAFEFLFKIEEFYYTLSQVNVKNVTYKDVPYTLVEAPLDFSFHCGNITFSSKAAAKTFNLPAFQVQIFEENSNNTGKSFGDAYDCVGFTTIPIWTGIFTTFLMLIILSLGIAAMMDIRTMDRFDDPKGKTITINAEG